jgi:hypothetical protein
MPLSGSLVTMCVLPGLQESERVTIRPVSLPASDEESNAVVLIVGLLSICGLLYISFLALGGPVWMGVLFGTIELVVAWRVSPPLGGRSLRWITAFFGAFTVVWAVVWALLS